jgi:hypothetical protein
MYSKKYILYIQYSTYIPPLRDPTFLGTPDSAFEPYPDLPLAIPLCITPEDVEILSSRLSGAAGPGGTDAVEGVVWGMATQKPCRVKHTSIYLLAISERKTRQAMFYESPSRH